MATASYADEEYYAIPQGKKELAEAESCVPWVRIPPGPSNLRKKNLGKKRFKTERLKFHFSCASPKPLYAKIFEWRLGMKPCPPFWRNSWLSLRKRRETWYTH
jgi:hypothetical protein